MTEDILFDNIYVGHSLEDAQAFAKETFDVKKPLEKALEEAETKADEPESEAKSFKEDPVGFIREKAFSFIELATLDPVLAIKTQPETAAALGVSVLTLIGMLGALFGIVGSSQKPITKVSSHK